MLNCFCFFVLTIIYCMFSAMASTLNFAITLNDCHFLLSYFFFLQLVILPIYLNIFSVLPIRNGCHFWIYVCGYQIPSELALIISIKDPFIKKLSFSIPLAIWIFTNEKAISSILSTL